MIAANPVCSIALPRSLSVNKIKKSLSRKEKRQAHKPNVSYASVDFQSFSKCTTTRVANMIIGQTIMKESRDLPIKCNREKETSLSIYGMEDSKYLKNLIDEFSCNAFARNIAPSSSIWLFCRLNVKKEKNNYLNWGCQRKGTKGFQARNLFEGTVI